VKMGTDWGALGFAAQYEEGFSGQHAGELLVIVDEASGVAAPIWPAISRVRNRCGFCRRPGSTPARGRACPVMGWAAEKIRIKIRTGNRGSQHATTTSARERIQY
jgi:hypothetical protein